VLRRRVPAHVQFEDHPARAVDDAAVLGEREAEVGLADPGRAVHDGERAGPEATAEHGVELGKAGGDARRHSGRFYTDRPLVTNWRSRSEEHTSELQSRG